MPENVKPPALRVDIYFCLYQHKFFDFRHNFFGKGSVADDTVKFRNVAEVVPKPVVDLAVVHHEHFYPRLFHQRIAHFVFGNGSVRCHAGGGKSVTGDKTDVSVVLPDGEDGGLADQGIGFVDALSARTDMFEVCLAEHIGGFDPAGDDDDVLESFQLLDEMGSGGGCVEHDDVSILNESACLFCEGALDVEHMVFAGRKRHVCVCRNGV